MGSTVAQTESLLTSSPLVDLGAIVQDLAEVCRSPLAAGEPAVGRATLALSDVTTTLSEVARRRGDAASVQEQIREAMARAREALDSARSAIEKARRTRGRAVELTAASIRLRQPLRPPAQGPMLRSWTSVRDVAVACPRCRRRFTLHYEYRFMEGLAPRLVACPRPPCPGVLTFYCPLDCLDFVVRP